MEQVQSRVGDISRKLSDLTSECDLGGSVLHHPHYSIVAALHNCGVFCR